MAVSQMELCVFGEGGGDIIRKRQKRRGQVSSEVQKTMVKSCEKL
jgi:hypothetical protein